MNAEMGWYILGEAQQHVGPYALSELRGKPFIYLVVCCLSGSVEYHQLEYLELFWIILCPISMSVLRCYQYVMLSFLVV